MQQQLPASYRGKVIENEEQIVVRVFWIIEDVMG